MFSNQYMGTRPTSRSLPRFSTHHHTCHEPGPYSRPIMNQRPINARCDDDDDNEVDYSFMNLPVRERRKLFLGGGAPLDVQRGYGTFMSMPRNRNPVFVQPRSYETQSEYGGEYECHSPNWPRSSCRDASNHSSQRSRSSKTFSLIPVNRCNSNINNGMMNHMRNHSDVHIVTGNDYSPRGCSPRPVNEPCPNTNAVRILTVPPARQRSCTKVIESPSPVHCAPTIRLSNRNSTPLRVNVYNSDGMSNCVSPRSSHHCGPPSPVYPAYPACKDRTTIIEVPTPRFRREQSAKPITVCPSKMRPLECRPTKRPCQVNSSHMMYGHGGHGCYDQFGVSDF